MESIMHPNRQRRNTNTVRNVGKRSDRDIGMMLAERVERSDVNTVQAAGRSLVSALGCWR